MLFGLICLILVLGVAYFHWIQGVFSGAISMALALVAATLSIGMHESIVTGILAGKMGDMSSGLVLLVLFLAIYGIGRVVFDSAVPGYVQVPLYFDKVGGLICGLVAGVCCVGTIAVAAQSMPFGPSIVGFSRHEFEEDKTVAITGTNNRQADAELSGLLKVEPESAAMPPAEKDQGMIMPVDQWAVDFASYQSRAGAFAGGRSLAADHPNLLRELFFGRVGVQPGAKRTAMNAGSQNDVTLAGVYAPESLLQAEGEPRAIRSRNLPPRLVADAKSGKVLLVVRLTPAKATTDKDGKFRFSTGTVRLVADGKDYYPIGTMHYAAGTPVMLAARVDDYLIGSGAAFDVVFELPRTEVIAGDEPNAMKVKKDVFVEVKRYARVDLSGKDVAPALPQTPESGILRKNALTDEVAKRIAEGGAAAPRK